MRADAPIAHSETSNRLAVKKKRRSFIEKIAGAKHGAGRRPAGHRTAERKG